MSSCGSCGEQLASKWNFCIYCGAALKSMSVDPMALVRSPLDQLAELTGGIVAEPHVTPASRVAAGAVLFLSTVTVVVVGAVYVIQSQH